MTGYILRRLLFVFPMLLGISIVTFIIINAAPGDPITLLLAGDPGSGFVPSEASIAALKEKYGLNKPLPVRYLDWLKQVLRGNLGKSPVTGEQVSSIIAKRVPNTLKLSGLALLLALLIGLPLGIVSAVKQYSVIDHVLTFLAFVGISIPTFFVALMLLLVFGVWLHWLPVFGMRTIAFEGGLFASFWDSFTHYILPVAALVIVRLCAFMRYQRSSMLDVIRQDYVRTARAKGLSERVVIFVHAWRNSLFPIITLMGSLLVTLVEGSVVVEFIFNWPGMGQAIMSAVQTRDYNVIMAAMLLGGTAIVLGTLVADILYTVADPRVRFTKQT